MSNKNSPQQLEAEYSAPRRGAEVISKTSDSASSLEPELLERVEEIARVAAVTTLKHEMFAGPMPSAKQLKEYDVVLPGTALIIREEFQSNGRHIRLLEE